MDDDKSALLEVAASPEAAPPDKGGAMAATIQGPTPAHKRRWRTEVLVLLVLASFLLVLHIFFVLLLRKTTVSLDELTIPDLCHPKSQGEVVLGLNNPSYCVPRLRPISLVLGMHDTELLRLGLPPFAVAAGRSTVVSDVTFEVLATPEVIHEMVFVRDGSAVQVHGEVTIDIGCLLIPFALTLRLDNLPAQLHMQGHALGGTVWGRGDALKDELTRLIHDIFRTIALSHIHTQSDANELFAFTDVSFNYTSPVLWNLPSLSVQLETETRETILVAGVKRFLLGGGLTFISAFSEIYKNETAPLEGLLGQYLGGTDVTFHVQGRNPLTDCLSLRVLDLVDTPIRVPAKIDGQPALLRAYNVAPTLKELDSTTHTCLLELDVVLTLHDPLPIHFELFELSFDLLYWDRSVVPTHTHALTRIDDRQTVSWAAHETHDIAFSTVIRDFGTCSDLIGVYLGDNLVFALTRGRIAMAAGPWNFTIPFEVAAIPIHPSGNFNFSGGGLNLNGATEVA